MSFIFGFSLYEFLNLVFSGGTFLFVMLIYFLMRRDQLDRGGVQRDAIHIS